MVDYLLLIVLAYLFASIPFGLLIGQYGYGIDVRTEGSGNIGTTNVLRTLGVFPAILVLLCDMGKGMIAVYLGRFLLGTEAAAVIGGLVAIFGHSCSCFLRFRGGKGVATGLGVLVMLNPVITFFVVCLFVLVVALTKYVSLGSVLGAVVLPFLMFFAGQPRPHLWFALLAALFVVYRHKTNLVRLAAGTENKIGQKQ